MKLFKKLLSAVAVCVCCIALAASAGCNNGHDNLSAEDKILVQLYGSVVQTRELEVKNGELSKASINAVYEIPSLDNNYLINVTGKEGYTSGNYPDEVGTVTCMVALIVNNGVVTEIKGVTIIDNENQIFISDITQDNLDRLALQFKPGISFNAQDNLLITGATKSCQAICNAVNGAIEYLSREIL